MDTLLEPLVVAVTRRWYVAMFLAAYLLIAVRHLGGRRVALFSALAAALSWLSEAPSIRVGFPYGLYGYFWGGESGIDPREPSILGVPCFSTLSYVFLNYAALAAALTLLGIAWPSRARARAAVAALAAALVVALDTVIDPIALRGDRWFLGRIYHYPGGGEHWGVPITNYAGWLLVGAAIAGAFLALEARVRTPRPSRALANDLGTGLYFGIMLFNLAVTFAVGEPALAWSSAAIVAPLLVAAAARRALTARDAKPIIRSEEEIRS